MEKTLNVPNNTGFNRVTIFAPVDDGVAVNLQVIAEFTLIPPQGLEGVAHKNIVTGFIDNGFHSKHYNWA